MKPYFIQDDDGNYLNPDYIFNIQVIRFCNLGSLFAFETVKKVRTSSPDLPSFKNIETYNVHSWMESFHKIFPDFEEELNSYSCENLNLKSFEISDLINVEKHTALESDKISHINSIYGNNTLKYFEIIYIDSDQATIKEFESEELAQAWINENFTII
ncbi:hypothetical protein P7L54_00505 [Acinetobacter bereziniae]|uniref:hypothetical protein n=1 Tax=Acinetobacter bereziniae TaxID=106648 RepID=UPI0019060D3B|nr:hypothetical protein [Acinetobacter bereziniae]MDG3554446.1 hypothetical protein [Acinetobacter bereziniae]MDP6003265.1 hypothetical protein [Acinetobacter bereziniae]QQC79275.1 hypothetical protein I9192_15005 [Acinetobacter bereziniae]UUN92350.1 hypothetical protein I9189_014870 [Acinetobacter bereziniae]WMW73456.1 hypothetical protein RG306_14380 [Acinetobacter bereziniae]